jgi:hypothetical protein
VVEAGDTAKVVDVGAGGSVDEVGIVSVGNIVGSGVIDDDSGLASADLVGTIVSVGGSVFAIVGTNTGVARMVEVLTCRGIWVTVGDGCALSSS